MPAEFRSAAANKRSESKVVLHRVWTTIRIEIMSDPHNLIIRSLGLTAVVCPLTQREVERATTNMQLWNDALFPIDGDEIRNLQASLPALIYSFNCAPDASIQERLQSKFQECKILQRCFSSIQVHFCSLSKEKDFYLRSSEINVPQYGYKSGPNWLFYETLNMLKDDHDFIFLMETDCYPLKPDWLTSLVRLAHLHKNSWILGGMYSGVSPLHWSVARHLNGNAVYHVGDREFWKFFDGRLWAWMAEYIRSVDPHLAYDCAWETFINRGEMEDPANEDWSLVRKVSTKILPVPEIINIGGSAEQAGNYVWHRQDIVGAYENAVVVHGSFNDSDEFRDAAVRFGNYKKASSAQITRSGLELRMASSGEALFSRTVWHPTENFQEGDRVLVELLFQTGEEPKKIEVDVREAFTGLAGRTRIAQLEREADGFRAKVRATIKHKSRFLMIQVRCKEPIRMLRVMRIYFSVRRGDSQFVGRSSLLRANMHPATA